MLTQTTSDRRHRFHQPEFGCEVVDMTPQMARELLAFNTKNRKLNNDSVAQLCADIEAGGWFPTNQGIGFDINGSLSDGQHRLEAIANGQTTVRILVVFGLHPKAQLVIDAGTPRKLKQRLALAGENIHTTALGVAHNMLRRERNWGYKLPQTDIQHKIATERGILDYIVDKTSYKACPGAFRRFGFLTAIAEYLKKSPDKARDFFEQCVGDGAGICRTASILRGDLMKPRNGNGSEIETDYKKTLQSIHCFHFDKESPVKLRGLENGWKF